MGPTIGWGLWIAGCALIVGVAKFVDEYHVKQEVKSTVRDALVKIFIFLDQPKITNFPAASYYYLTQKLRMLGKWGIIVAIMLTYFAMVGCFYLYRLLVRGERLPDFLTYALWWIDGPFCAIVILWGICTGAATFISVSAFLDRWNNTNLLYRNWILSLLLMLTLTLIVLGTAVGFFILGSLNPQLGILGVVSGSGVALKGSPTFLIILSLDQRFQDLNHIRRPFRAYRSNYEPRGQH
jgi:hypothetical protein